MSARKDRIPGRLIIPLPQAATPLRMRVLSVLDSHKSRMLASGNESHDYKLQQIGTGMGLLANSYSADITQQTLRSIAAYCFGWLESCGIPSASFKVAGERDRQISLRKQFPNRYLVDMASATADESRKYRVLIEEVGEVAKAIDKLERRNNSHYLDHLCDELAQVAAVAVAWLESLEVKS